MRNIDNAYRYKVIKFSLSRLSYKVGITNPTPLKNNLVLEI
jgi:hypothetical protein